MNTDGDGSPSVVSDDGNVQSAHIFNARHRLHGRVSSHLALLFLHPAQAAAARLPEAMRFAVLIALTKDFLSFKASIGTVLHVWIGVINL